MITVIFTRAPDELRMEVQGHANTAPHGEDLVCASVSVLAQTYVAALLTHGFEPEYRIEAGDMVCSCSFKSDKTMYGRLLTDVMKQAATIRAIHHTIETGMAYLAESYPEYVEVIKKQEG